MEEGQKQLFRALTVYRERGAHLRRLEQFGKSKASYDEAHNSTPNDVRTLIGRSQVAVDAVHPELAYPDAELALKLEPNNMTALNMQARALQTMTEFEKSVVINYRGNRKRKQPPYFMEGVNQGIQIIEDSIGVNAGNVMDDFFPIIRQLEKNRLDEHEPQKILHESRIPQPESKKRFTQMEARKQSILARVLAMKYLGPMAYDKFFLQKLVKDPRLKSANASGSLKLKQIANEAFRSLKKRQDILRSQRPYYTIKFAEKSESKYQDKFMERNLIMERHIGARTAEKLLKQIDKCLRENRIKDLMSQAERMQIFLDKKTPRSLPDKEHYIDRLYKAVGEGYLNQHRLSYTLSERSNKRRIAFLMGLPVGRPTSYDSVIANYPYKFIDIKQVTAKVLTTLDMCENATMKCWLLYELSRLLCTQKNYALSKFYAKRCQREAHEIDSATWWLNGCFALMSGDMQQGNSNEVKVQVEEAYQYTKNLANSERIAAFLARCHEIASNAKSGDDKIAILQRQKQIVGVMDKTQQDEAGLLFKSMSTVPFGRRFSVLPTKRDSQSDQSERKYRRQTRLSIVPGPEQTLPSMPQSDTPGYQLFDI